jgi:hypothetical protein
MNTARLEKNIGDVIKEEQVKLGYRSEKIQLFYPLKSLNRFLQTDFGEAEMERSLTDFCKGLEPKFGKVAVSHEGERFCFHLPSEAADYVHAHTPQSGFLYDFIAAVSQHGVTIEDVIALFKKYSDHVHVEKTTHGEFDYLVYFADGEPDSFRYCLTAEGHHIIYHRFTAEDYEDFQFEEQ